MLSRINQRLGRKSLFFGGIILLALTVKVPAASAADSKWEAQYWNNRDLSGEPVLERLEDDLNYHWGEDSPASEVNEDEFSARWKRRINVSAGMYRFIATADDGMRVWVDDLLVVDSWYDSQEHVVNGDVYLTTGQHRIKVEYYEFSGQAVAKLFWVALPVGPAEFNYWRGEYFNNTNLAGPPVLVRDDPQIDFDWGAGSPAWGTVSADQFSARWSRELYFNAGRYRFLVTTDDGFRLWVNNTLLIDSWQDQAAAVKSAEIDLPGGFVPIKLEYFENQGGARAALAWTEVDAPIRVSGWLGEYYNNPGFVDPPAMIREDTQIDFNWGTGSPAAGLVNPNNFTVRWTRTVDLKAGRHRFVATTDDGFRLWVNDKIVMHVWEDHAAATHIAEIDLPGGSTTIKMEYYENQELAEAHLSWTYVDPAPTTAIPATRREGERTATVIIARHLNVRSGPGMEFPPFSYLNRDQVVELTGFRDRFANWIEIYLPDGRRGWVVARFLASAHPFVDLAVWSE